MVSLLWTLLFLAAYPYLIYPLLLAACCLLRGRPVLRQPCLPSLSVIITAYNEEHHLAAKLDNTLALDYPCELREVIVVSDGSTDGTEQVARKYAEQGVRLLSLPRGGKTAAVNAGVAASRGEALLFTDVTAHLPSQAARLMVENLSDKSVGVVSVPVSFGDPTVSMTARGLGLRQGFDNWVRACQSRLYTLFGATGACYLMRRSAFRPLPMTATSDFVSALWALQAGYRNVLEERVLVTMTRRPPGLGAEYARRVRIVQGGLEGLWLARGLLNPWRWRGLAFSLVSARLARYLVPVWALLLIPVSLLVAWREGGGYWLLPAFQAAGYGGALLGWLAELRGRRLRALHIPFYFCLVHAAALAGLLRALAGRRITTWETRR